MKTHFAYALIMLIAGLGIPVMAALNSALGTKLQNPILATTILFAAGLVFSIFAFILSGSYKVVIPFTGIPWYLYLGGVFVLLYILSITWVAPRFGIANSVAFVLLGQLIAMTFIDHFGIFGAPQYSITGQRIAGLFMMTVGVFMVLNRAPSG